MSIIYKTGDATYPTDTGAGCLILHGCNDVGKWGRGFVLAVSQRWKAPEEAYLAWARNRFAARRLALGLIQCVQVSPGITVVNCITQRDIYPVGNIPPIRYDAVAKCFDAVTEIYGTTPNGLTIHMPRLGCGLAGGSWEKIEALIEKHLCDKGYPVTVYDLPK